MEVVVPVVAIIAVVVMVVAALALAREVTHQVEVMAPTPEEEVTTKALTTLVKVEDAAGMATAATQVEDTDKRRK